MRYMYTTNPDEDCHEVNGSMGRPVHRTEEAKLKSLGWTLTPIVSKAKEPTIKEQAIALGIPTEEDGKPIHHKTLAKQIEAAKNDQGGTSTENT